MLARLAKRDHFFGGSAHAPGESAHSADQPRAVELKEAFSHCFGEENDESATLKDEFSAKLIEFVVSECQALLQKTRGGAECWLKMAKFLDQELWKLSRLKEEFAEAEKQVGMVRKKLEEASAPLNGEVNQKRVLACTMLLAEKEMRRDHLQGRVSMIIEQFVARILAGTHKEPGGEVLELRLRGVFGSL